jgi:inosine-uridine nucleoside N-ribohydrolase
MSGVNRSGRQRILMDVDTGVDDAAAILLATRLPELELLAVTTLAGNVSVDLTTENTLRMLNAAGRPDIPVHRGMSVPLARPLRDASHFHGRNGLGDVELPPSPARAGAQSGPQAMIDLARANPGAITFVCVGPLTNLAVALSLEPELPRLVRHVVLMGGAFLARGNVTPDAEFNAWADPEAAAIVARSLLPLTFIGLDVTHQTLFPRASWEALRERPNAESRLIYSLFRRTFEVRHDASFPLHDPLAVGVAAFPDLVRTERSAVAVVTGLVPDSGKTLLVRDPRAPVHDVALEVDDERFLALFGERLLLR